VYRNQIAQARDIRGDVARHREIQQQHRPVPAQPQSVFDLRAMQYRRAAGGGGNHDVGFGQMPVELGQRQGHAAMASGEILRMGQGAVGDQQALGFRFHQMPSGQFDGLAGTDQQHGRFTEPGKTVLRQAYRDGRHRHRIRADTGIGARALGGGEGLLEQAIQLPAECPGLARGGPRLFHLPEDLRLAQHQRIQAGGDPEQVAHGVAVVMPVQVVVQIVASVRMGGQPVRQCTAVVVGMRVQLGAVAGGEQHRLADLRQGTQGRQRRRQSVLGERHFLAQGNRRGLVVDAEDVQAHCGFCRCSEIRSGACAKLQGRPTIVPAHPHAHAATLDASPLAGCGRADFVDVRICGNAAGAGRGRRPAGSQHRR